MEGKDISINISDVFRVFLRRWWIILLAAVITFVPTWAFERISYDPVYTSTAKIMVRNPDENLSASSSAYYSDLTKTAVNDCQILMTSRTALYQVIDELALANSGITYGGLLNMIRIEGYPDSHVLEVSVTTSDPMLSKEIVDMVCKVGANQIESHIDFATARVVDEGTTNRHPSNSVNTKTAVMLAFLAAIITFGVFILIYIVDDKIRTPDDVEKRLGLSLLGVIPYTEPGSTNRGA